MCLLAPTQQHVHVVCSSQNNTCMSCVPCKRTRACRVFLAKEHVRVLCLPCWPERSFARLLFAMQVVHGITLPNRPCHRLPRTPPSLFPQHGLRSRHDGVRTTSMQNERTRQCCGTNARTHARTHARTGLSHTCVPTHLCTDSSLMHTKPSCHIFIKLQSQ